MEGSRGIREHWQDIFRMSTFVVLLPIELPQLRVCPYLLPLAVETREVYGSRGGCGAYGYSWVKPCPAFDRETGGAHGRRNGMAGGN